jgi:Tol biopolymer transport system component
MKPAIATALLLSWCVAVLAAQESPLWLRYPAISPDGQTLLFEYKGDIWSVPASGGNAVPLTLSESYEFAPVWSHDGKSVAFASDRYGSFDVFVMPATGGEARRLTWHSTREVPSSFSADDKTVLFSGARQDLATHAQFPTPGMTELYSVPVGGGRVSLVLTTPALDATVSSKGDKIIFHDYKGYESDWRKHHTSAVTRDIWVYDTNARKYTQVSAFAGEDRNPGLRFERQRFLLPDRAERLVQRSQEQPARSEAVGADYSFHEASRSLPVARSQRHAGVLVRRRALHAGAGRTAAEGGGADRGRRAQRDREVPAGRRRNDGGQAVPEWKGIRVRVSWGDLRQQHRRKARQAHHEHAVAGTNRQLQSGRPCARLLSRKGQQLERLYDLAHACERAIFLRLDGLEGRGGRGHTGGGVPAGVFSGRQGDRLPREPPDAEGLQHRIEAVSNGAAGNHNYSYSDGDQYYSWSPDSRWFLVQFAPSERIFAPEVGIVSADGKSEVRNLTQSGYDDAAPKWAVDGKMMIWGTTRDGALAQGGGRFRVMSTGCTLPRRSTTVPSSRRRNSPSSKSARKRERRTARRRTPRRKKADEKDKPAAPIAIDWDGVNDRKIRLTINTSAAADWVLSKDGERLFYLTSFEKGKDLWVTDVRTRETKLFNKLGADNSSMELSPDGKFLFVMADGRAVKVDAESGKSEPIGLKTEMVLDYSAEKSYIFDHSWRQFKQKLIFPDLQKVDWDYYYAAYKKFLPHINNNWDFAEMLSEMLGEMNVSHTGASYRPNATNVDATASLGLLYDYAHNGKGVKSPRSFRAVRSIWRHRPPRPGTSSKPSTATTSTRRWIFTSCSTGKPASSRCCRSSIPPSNRRWEENGETGQRRRRRGTALQTLGPPAPAEVDQALRRQDRLHPRPLDERCEHARGLRRSAGTQRQQGCPRRRYTLQRRGNIHEQLSDFLSGKKYFDVVPHGQYVGSEPFDKWIKPSIVLVGESNYSDAHLFPLAYKAKNLGLLVGMPVPGTGTFVWWENQIDATLRFGIPMGCWRSLDGKCGENNQTDPDIRVANEPDVMAGGRDQQIEAAVRELMRKRTPSTAPNPDR